MSGHDEDEARLRELIEEKMADGRGKYRSISIPPDFALDSVLDVAEQLGWRFVGHGNGFATFRAL